ncbi:MAG TPA: hypothetical protein V6D22_03540 [Candidatus Obscuribacterales bacterium]
MNHRIVACLSLLVIIGCSAPAFGQNTNDPTGFNRKYGCVGDFDRVNDQWYEAPREIQVIDERPVVRDFRKTPSSAKTNPHKGTAQTPHRNYYRPGRRNQSGAAPHEWINAGVTTDGFTPPERTLIQDGVIHSLDHGSPTPLDCWTHYRSTH